MDIKKINNEIQVIPLAGPAYSLELICAGARPLVGIKITGFCEPCAHNAVINIYGLSKSGFFIERTTVFSGELYTERNADSLIFDCSDIKLNIKHEFFRALKNTADGKIYAEVNVDGVKYTGASGIKLFPPSVYPHSASPSVFTAFLSPCHSEIERISNSAGKSLPKIYNALKNERFIYSVKECDFISENVAVGRINDIFSRHSKMASPLEMAAVFCSCALHSEIFPVIAVLKCAGGIHSRVHILCGALSECGKFGMLTASPDRLRELVCCGKLSLFDVSCLFTGHNVDFDNAAKNAYEALCAEELVFGLDIADSVCHGVVFSSNFGGEDKLIENLKKNNAVKISRRTLSDYAELLSDTEKTPLLHFENFRNFSIRIFDSKDGLQNISDAALNGDAIDIAINTLPGEFCANTKSSRVGKSNGYLACGFLCGNGFCAPAALYPVRIIRREKENGVHIEFISAKPHINRLLVENLKRNPACRGVFERYGGMVPSGSLESIMNFYKNLCETVPLGYRLNDCCECVAGVINYRDSLLAFSIVDKYDRIVNDRLSSAILSGNEYDSIPGMEYERKISELLTKLPDVFPGKAYEASACSADSDIIISQVGAHEQADIAAAISCKNIGLSCQTLIISENAAERRYIAERIESMGMGGAVLILSEDTDIKKCISRKLVSLSKAVPFASEAETFDGKKSKMASICDEFTDYLKSKKHRYDFDFSFDDAARAYINAGEGLSAEEKLILLEPENLFFPDLGKKSAEEIFSSQIKLCRAAAALCARVEKKKGHEKYPLSNHPLYHAKLTGNIPDGRTFVYLAGKCVSELRELMLSCREISDKTGFDIGGVKSLPSLHAYLSLIVLISKEYDSDISDSLLMSDIYAVSKKLTELRNIYKGIEECDRELCEFDGGIYKLDCKKLSDEWLSQSDGNHSDITKTVNAYRTVSLSADVPKKSVSEVLTILNTRAAYMSEFVSGSGEMNEIFTGYWNTAGGIDWDKISELTDFTKNAVVLLKKIYGTDSESRVSAVGCFRKISDFCLDKLNLSRVLGAAGLFDRMFSENGGIISLASSISADLYNMNFADGIFSENRGLQNIIAEWQRNVDMLSAAAEYNICALHCRSIGLSCFADYLETEGYTANIEKIFTRSLLFLALKQIALKDRKMLSMSGYEEKLCELLYLLSENCDKNKNMFISHYVKSCVDYINSNPSRSEAFAESLDDKKVSADELLLRYEDTIKTMFPVIIAEPSFAAMMSGFENEVICSAHNVKTERVIPILHCGRHKVVLSGADGEFQFHDCFADDCQRAGVPSISINNAERRFVKACSINAKIEYKRTPVSSFDRHTLTNVLEAQTIGLEIMNAVESEPEISVGICSFTENQKKALCEVMEVVAEKSAAVSRAFSEGKICISDISDFSAGGGKYDIVYISTVYGGEDIPQLDAAATEFPFGGYFSSSCLSAVMSSCFADKKIVVVSSMRNSGLACTAGSDNLCRLALFNEFALCGGRMVMCSKNGLLTGLYDEFVSEFCRIVSESGFSVYTADGGKYAVIRICGREYGAVIEESCAEAAYSGKLLKESGITPLYFDSADIVLNPNKIIDCIKSLEVKNT